jgi:hypothetical protein
MSKLSNRRKAMGYTVKRCATCEHFRDGYVYLTTDSQTRRSKPLCKVGEFTIAPHGLCDEWEQAVPVRQYPDPTLEEHQCPKTLKKI